MNSSWTETQPHHRWRFNHHFLGELGRQINQNWSLRVGEAWLHWAHSFRTPRSPMVVCATQLLMQFCSLSINNISINDRPPLLPDVNVLCVFQSTGASFQCIHRSQAPHNSARALQAGENRSTRKPQRIMVVVPNGRWKETRTGYRKQAALCSRFSPQQWSQMKPLWDRVNGTYKSDGGPSVTSRW